MGTGPLSHSSERTDKDGAAELMGGAILRSGPGLSAAVSDTFLVMALLYLTPDRIFNGIEELLSFRFRYIGMPARIVSENPAENPDR